MKINFNCKALCNIIFHKYYNKYITACMGSENFIYMKKVNEALWDHFSGFRRQDIFSTVKSASS